jgi:hypothetical protein
MTVGMDPLAQGLDRHSSVIPTGDKGVRGTRQVYATNIAERVASLVVLLCWWIPEVGRGDMSERSALNRSSIGPFGPKLEIAYVDPMGVARTYLPDLVCCTANGSPVIVEAGLSFEKGQPSELAKLMAAKSFTDAAGGETFVIAADLVPARWVRGAIRWLLARFDYRGDVTLVHAVEELMLSRRMSIRDVVAQNPNYPEVQVIAAAGKVIGDWLAEGRLGVDLAVTVINMGTPIWRIPPNEPRVEPPGIIRDLERLRELSEARPADGSTTPGQDERHDVDADSIDDPALRDEFLRRRAAVTEMLGGASNAADVARRHGLEVRRFQQLWRAFLRVGEPALKPYASRSTPELSLPKAIVDKIGELHTQTLRPSVQGIVDSPELHAVALELGLRRSPTWYQVNRVVMRLQSTDEDARKARAGRRLEPLAVTGRAVTTELVPGAVCEFDEHTVDVKVLAVAGSPTTIRLHIGLLIDVATRYPLSVVMAPKALDQWDVRRAILRALLPDTDLRRRFDLRSASPWGGRGGLIPCVIRTDNGKIERSRLAIQIAGDLPFILEFAPRRDAHAKPVVESAFKSLNALFGHQIAITTKNNPEALGAHDPDTAAIERGIDVPTFERAFMQAIYDVYVHRVHGKLHASPAHVLSEGLSAFPVRQWQGTPDELRRLLRRDEGTRLIDRHGISYKGEWYGAAWVTPYGLGRTVRIKVDEDDVRSLDVYDESGVFLGEVVSDRIKDLYGRAVSRWEIALEREAVATLAKAAKAETDARLDEIKSDMNRRERDRRAARARHHRERAAETNVASGLHAEHAGTAASRSAVPPTLPLPVADSDTTYETLVDDAA